MSRDAALTSCGDALGARSRQREGQQRGWLRRLASCKGLWARLDTLYVQMAWFVLLVQRKRVEISAARAESQIKFDLNSDAARNLQQF